MDDTGDLINTITYDSFGNIVSQTDASAGDRFTYTGREYDAELDLYYYRARYYDPQLGRFVSQDPIGFAAGDANLYRYVGNRPTIHVDPSGLDWLDTAANWAAGWGDTLSFGGTSRSWKSAYPLPSRLWQQWTRFPNLWKGTFTGAGYGGLSNWLQSLFGDSGSGSENGSGNSKK